MADAIKPGPALAMPGKRVLLISTGGTITMTPSSGAGGIAPTLTGEVAILGRARVGHVGRLALAHRPGEGFGRPAADAARRPRAVVVRERVDARLVVLVRHEVHGDRARLLRRERLLRQRHELAVDARAEHVARLDVQVGRAAIHRRLDDAFHIGQYPAFVSTRLRNGSPPT